jgi:hypothetical protein
LKQLVFNIVEVIIVIIFLFFLFTIDFKHFILPLVSPVLPSSNGIIYCFSSRLPLLPQLLSLLLHLLYILVEQILEIFLGLLIVRRSSGLLRSAGKGVHSNGLMLEEDLVIEFVLRSDFDCVLRGTTTLLFNVGREPKTGRAATGVSALVAPRNKFGFLWMISALDEFIAGEGAFAGVAVERNESCPDFPVDVLPLDQFLSIHELDESIQVEEPISHMLRDHLPVEIDEYLRVGAHYLLVLVVRV